MRKEAALKIAYFDCFAGISGDMVLGALVDAGLELDFLRRELGKMPPKDFKIVEEKTEKKSLAATKISVLTDEKGVVRTWSNVEDLINQSSLDDSTKAKSKEIFLKLAEAEAKIHQTEIKKVHFHEVGATDSIVDIVGAVIGLKKLGVEEVYSSAIATGFGLIKTEHGSLPVPAPAVLEILKDVPIYSQDIPNELTTPTGAAIIKTFAKDFGEMPLLKPLAIGYGAGSRDLEIPNLLRIVVGEREETLEETQDEVLLIETNIDDTNPEFYSYITEKLFAEGALDVWTTPIAMKKGRPATKISVLSPLPKEEVLADVIFQETSTLGVRVSKHIRHKAKRQIITVGTVYGQVRVKIGRRKGKVVSVSPEYEDCAKLAKENQVAIKVVYEEAKKAAQEKLSSDSK